MKQNKKKNKLMAIEKMTANELRAEIHLKNNEITTLRSCIKDIISLLTEQGILNKDAEIGRQNIGSLTQKAARDIYQSSGNVNVTNNYYIVIGSHNHQAGRDVNLSSNDG